MFKFYTFLVLLLLFALLVEFARDMQFKDYPQCKDMRNPMLCIEAVRGRK